MGNSFSNLFIDVSTFPENGFGFFQLIFLGAVYMTILKSSSEFISEGSELLLLIPSLAGLVGSVVLPILGAVPDAAMVLFSGIGPLKKVQEEVSVGVGALAGSTIMLLTIPWAMTIFYGRVSVRNGNCTYAPASDESRRTFQKLHPEDSYSLSRCGVQPHNIRKFSYMVLLTALSYVCVQIPAFRQPSASALSLNPGLAASVQPYALVSFVACLILFVIYLCFCVWSSQQQELTEGRIEGAKRKALLDRLTSFSELYGQDLLALAKTGAPSELTPLVSCGSITDRHYDSESAAERTLHSMFLKYDTNHDGVLDRSEMVYLLRDLNETTHTADEFMALFDKDSDKVITLDEFRNVLQDLLVRRKDKAAGVLVLPDAVGVASTESGHDSASRLSGIEEEEDQMPDDLQHLSPFQQKVRVLWRAFWMMGLGAAGVLIFSDPMVSVLSELGQQRLGIGSFYVSFVLAPMASNLSEVVAAGSYAAKRTERSCTIAMQQLLGAAIMNNTLCLGVFLALIKFRDLPWVYTAETITILFVEVAVCLIVRRKVQVRRVLCGIRCFIPSLCSHA